MIIAHLTFTESDVRTAQELIDAQGRAAFYKEMRAKTRREQVQEDGTIYINKCFKLSRDGIISMERPKLVRNRRPK